MRTNYLSYLKLVFLGIIFHVSMFPVQKTLSKQSLIEDTRQMVNIIESIHPDPYYFGGGKVAFHRRFYKLLNSIPEKGMSISKYSEMVLPFLAKIGDGHTYIIPSNWYTDKRIGFPLYMSVVEKKIYVSGVYSEKNRFLLNSTLIEVEGIPINILVERGKNILATENKYHNLRRLVDGLKKLARLKLLIPEWKNFNKIMAKFISSDGKILSHSFTLSNSNKKKLIINKSSIILPSVEKTDFNFKYMDIDKKTALLRIEDMQTYRECHEHWRFYGNYYKELARKTYTRYHGKKSLSDINSVINALPSATECFRELVISMKKNKSKNLIIDLRKNPGGVSNISEILMYFIYGRQTIVNVQAQGYQIRKHSDLYYRLNKGEKFKPSNSLRKIPLTINDYDFFQESRYNSKNNINTKKKQMMKELDEMAHHMPTFEKEYLKGKYEKLYTPENIIVLTSERTFSSAFWMLQCLKKAGAKIVGTPSGQAPNTFSDQNPYTLKNSRLTLYMTYKMSYTFPELSSEVDVLMPDYLLTYKKLKEYNFDPNAEVILAIDLFNK